MHYLITGGTGFVAQNFIKSINMDVDQVTILSRQSNILSSKNYKVIQDLNEIKSDTKFDVIINLAGSPIDRRWTKEVKQDLLNSRINTTRAAIALIKRLKNRPSLLISASAIGYYGSHDAMSLDEFSSPKSSFTHDLCKAWEEEANKVKDLGVRLCITRFGVVLGKNGGFINKIHLPFKLGLGGRLGNGKQYFSWIHIDDVVKGMKYLISQDDCQGPYNFVAPEFVTNAEMTNIVGRTLNRPTCINLPSFLVKLFFAEMGEELLLKGNKIQPARLISDGYKFSYPILSKALDNIL
ncbi:MAG: hypothetical protein DGJ47_000337 [Rickettsiaceae bacterium]